MPSYNPQVTDRSGEIRAAGLAQAMQGFGNYGMQGLDWARQSRQRQEDQDWRREMFASQQQAQERQFQLANARDQQRFAMEMQGRQFEMNERKAAAADRKAEAAAEADGLTAAVLQSFGEQISPAEQARVAAMPPGARKAWAMTQAKLIPDMMEVKRRQDEASAPLSFQSPPGGGIGLIMQGNRFLGSFSKPQSRLMDPERVGTDAAGAPVYGVWGVGEDGAPVMQRVEIPPGVYDKPPEPPEKPAMPRVFQGTDKEGNPVYTGLVPVAGGVQLQQLEYGKTIPIGQPSASVPSFYNLNK
jgi:hypothetical protein